MRRVVLVASRGRPRLVAANVDRPMVLEKRARPLSAHVALEHSYRSHGQIHQDERVEAVVEIRVACEAEHAAAELEVLLEQDGHPALATFELENFTFERGEVHGLRLPGRRRGVEVRRDRAPRSHETGETRKSAGLAEVFD